ncbi:CidA/LrgA family protein [uncultured Cohaesibacter sp.]|uniref:CidA/LrgA family protein n=1 Tax=uncultured Cohaesibacter sp. TaxID=1002546 RepID=UPI00292FED57|nr:CidA/LrgA family protein [uncultured Cohaesibacter sp.]
MLFYLTLIFLCQLLGEVIVTFFKLPFPGPVVGMALMFTGLLIKGSIPEGLGKAGDALLSNLTLLFIPAGVGIMANAELIQREFLPITISVVLSTFLAIAVTGLVMTFLTRHKPVGGHKGDAA